MFELGSNPRGSREASTKVGFLL